MALTYSTAAMRARIWRDIDAASAGTKRAAGRAAVRAEIGTGYRIELIRNGSTFFVGTDSDAQIPVSGTALVIALSDLNTTTWTTGGVSIDVDTGACVCRVVSVTNPERYIEGTLGRTAGDFLLSGVVPSAGASMSGVSISMSFPAALDTVFTHVLGINCGGELFTDGAGDAFTADQLFTSGNTSTVTTAITGTTDDTLYQTDRYAPSNYTIAGLSNGSWRVRLMFAETWSEITAAGQRVFTVRLQPGTVNEVEIANIDVFDAVGANAAYDLFRDVTVTNGTLVVTLSAQTQNPKICAIQLLSSAGGTYTAPAPSSGDTVAYAAAFKGGTHDARLGLMPSEIDWYNAGRKSTDQTSERLSGYLVPWDTIFAAYTTVWPTTVGVEVGRHELWGRLISNGNWTLLYYWNSLDRSFYKHNRDDYGIYGAGSENAGTATVGTNTGRRTSDGTLIVRRDNNATFPTQGTHIHGYFEGAYAVPIYGGRVAVDRTLYSQLLFRGRYRAVTWPSAELLAPIPNPAGYVGNEIVAGLGVDAYNAASGAFQSTYMGDIGIAKHAFVTANWKWIYWLSNTGTALTANPPSFLTP